MCIIRESEFYSKYKERLLKGFKQGSVIIHFILEKITGCCIEERLDENECDAGSRQLIMMN